MSVRNSGKLSFIVTYNWFKADDHKNSFVRAGHEGDELSPSQGITDASDLFTVAEWTAT